MKSLLLILFCASGLFAASASSDIVGFPPPDPWEASIVGFPPPDPWEASIVGFPPPDPWEAKVR
ncbi:MAG: hypothetical protein R2762_25340 [Bryobacteraceae bacterium]